MSSPGKVYLVGAGPGDPGLITRRGAELLGLADVIVYDGLVNTALLDLARPGAERIYAGKKHARHGPPMTQAQIDALIVERGRRGQQVVRLKGGDPFVFARGAEEIAALEAAGIPYEIVPGVTAALAVTAYAGIPLTARGSSATVAFATGHEADGKAGGAVDWPAVARAQTIVLYMALQTLDDCARELIAAGRDPDTPAAAVYWGTTAAQRTVTAPLRELPAAVRAAGLRPPVLVIIGEVVRLRPPAGSWYERRPLFGVRVLITREIDRAGELCHALAELGAEPVVCPVTHIVRDTDQDALAAALAALDRYHWVVFTSANAVDAFFSELAGAGRDARALAGARIACVGAVTAAALGPRLRADVVPRHGDARGVAEAVIAAAGPAIAGARVLLPRAAEGRDEAADALRAAGATVDLLPLYRSVPADPGDPALGYALSLVRDGKIDVVACFAPSQARALAALLGPDARELLGRCRVIAAIGNATRAALIALGLPVHVVPPAPDAAALASAIAARYKEL